MKKRLFFDMHLHEKNKTAEKNSFGSLAAPLGRVHNFASPPRGGLAFIEITNNPGKIPGILYDVPECNWIRFSGIREEQV